MGETILKVLIIVASFGCIVSSDSVVVKTMEMKTQKKTERLSCYHCLDYQPHCIALTNRTERLICAVGETFCQVLRLDFQEELRTLERRCTRSCEPGCENAGGYKRCTSCCNTTLCNIDSAANSVHYSLMAANSLITVIVALYIIDLPTVHISWQSLDLAIY